MSPRWKKSRPSLPRPRYRGAAARPRGAPLHAVTKYTHNRNSRISAVFGSSRPLLVRRTIMGGSHERSKARRSSEKETRRDEQIETDRATKTREPRRSERERERTRRRADEAGGGDGEREGQGAMCTVAGRYS